MKRFKDTDRGYKKRLASIKKAAGGKTITVGIHETEGAVQSGDTTIADIATFNEFGTSRIPERSFIRSWFDDKKAENADLLERAMRAVASGKVANLDMALDQVGAKFAGDIQRGIRDGIPPENDEKTIERKGSSTPLIDKGALFQSITWKVK
jgi:hypothetical protein